ncbi:MAG TPA: DNA gyrase subunit A [Thermoleophilia bacterium]|nr:DNA gyrase subunit A [Thermoleophilia bacterium]HQG02746.1 DNA gyrase subunit A [Thermoleophilia bacterium]HQJ97081.1 DNA gyrase subunit A [Thermoleophilia bacterium]
MSDTIQTLEGKIEPVELEDEMRSSFIDYAMSVLTDRAIPDVRDGLKPSQRRILVAMNDLGLMPNKQHRKCAKIAGDTSGNYHPHGEAVIYPTLVRMAQDFNMRYPLIDGQGNFGSVEGDPPAAMRYTEARLSRIAVEMLRDIDANTVDWVPNYDETRREPTVLPSRMPNLLVNGSAGIAVGMATNIPPHNLGEVVDAIVHLVDHPEASADDLMAFIKGPDFPTGGTILGSAGFKEAYRTGRGRIRVRAKAHTEQLKGGKVAIVVTELPFQVNRLALIDDIVGLVKSKKITEISDLRNESDRSGMRLVIELKREAVPMVVLNKLYKHTQMQTTFGVINIALVDGVPRTLTLPEMLKAYIAFQREVVVRRTKFELDKAETRAHILEGLLVALDNLDAVIAIIRKAADVETARSALMDTFELTQPQAQAILDLRLQKLTSLEREKVKEEHAGLLARIKELRELLGDEAAIHGVIKTELLEIKGQYNDDRRTEIVPDEGEIALEDLIADEQMAITITKSGYIKRLPVATYRQQKRGGVGVAGMQLKEEDEVDHLFITSTHHYLLFFTNVGKVYRLRVHELPLAGRNARGRHLANLLPLRQDEKVCAVIATRDFDVSEGKYLMFGTRKGMVKKTLFGSYNTPLRADGIIAIDVREGDELISVRHTSGDDDIIMVSRLGQGIRFHEGDVRPTGRDTAGVHGMRLRDGDEVISMDIARDDSDLFLVTDAGYGKRTPIREWRVQGRGGQGVIAIKLTRAKGYVAGVLVVRDNHEVMLQSRDGVVIRMRADGISRQSRTATGVRVMNLREGDVVSAVARMVVSDSGATDEEVEGA